MRLLLLAVRNLSRHRRRTLITAVSVIVGAVAVVFLQGFVTGLTRWAMDDSVLARVGPIQVHRRGYVGADEPLKKSLPDSGELRRALEAFPGVTAVAPRIAFEGLISNGAESTMFVATAIDPDAEYKVCPKRLTAVAKGSTPLSPGQNREALIGKTLVDSLGGEVGGTLVMQSNGPRGATNALDVHVIGFLPSAQPTQSRRTATVTLAFAQDLLGMRGEVTEWVVGVADAADAESTARGLRAALGADYDVTTWRDVDGQTRDMVALLRVVFGFIAFVLFFLVATGIVNTMLMSVYERVREIGTMLAVGVRRRQITLLFVYEALALGAVGTLVGVAIGHQIVHAIGVKGVVLHPPGGDETIIRPHVDIAFLGVLVGLTLLGIVAAALYPARRAARLRPIEALSSH